MKAFLSRTLRGIDSLQMEDVLDLTIDVGGAETLNQSLISTRVFGRVAMVGRLTGQPGIISASGDRLSHTASVHRQPLPVRAGARCVASSRKRSPHG
jgi:hypothetical protein